jgi:predicted lipid-binding transport protein (Tim44 family)
MNKRHVFSTPDLVGAEAAVQAARQAGIPDDDISLIARHDVEMRSIPDDRLETTGDFSRGGAKGLVGGGASGLIAGIIAVSIAPIGLAVAGVAVMTLIGAAVGGWVGMLAGTAVPDVVRRQFETEIEEGHILVVIDAEENALAAADIAVIAAGATPLPFEAPSITT